VVVAGIAVMALYFEWRQPLDYNWTDHGAHWWYSTVASAFAGHWHSKSRRAELTIAVGPAPVLAYYLPFPSVVIASVEPETRSYP
jgi:hypothetical protein